MIKREVPYISYQDFLLKVLEMAEFLTYHRKKILVAFVISALLMTGLCGQLGFLMIARSDHYSKMADALHERERTIKASRGEIVDRNGTVIAANRTVCTVSVIHNQVTEPEKVIRELVRILELPEPEVRKKVEKWSSREIIRTNVEKSVGDQIMNLGLSGVKVDEDYKRYYPYGSLASKVLGFTGADNQGIIGLEVMYERYLKGRDGLILTTSDAKGTELQNAAEERVEPVPGNTLTVSLDVNIQKYAEQAAYQVMEKKGAKAVSVIVMNPRNGEIYAMVNVPEFDLNDPFTLNVESGGLTGTELQDARNKMWRNRCINDTYEPGSTFKIITAAAGLEAGVVHLDDRFSCPGFRIVEDRKIRCHKIGGHGGETFLQGAMNSCNPVFIDVGARLGVDSFYHYFEQFGLLGKTGIDLPGEAATIMHKKENMGLVELATVSFGQSFQITTIRLAATVCSLINGGQKITPHCGVEVREDDGTLLETLSYKEGKQIVSEQVSKTMRMILEKVVSEGGGKKAYIEGYHIGGKTATSETLPRSANKYISSFLGFVPAEDPRILGICIINNPQGVYYGGTDICNGEFCGNTILCALHTPIDDFEDKNSGDFISEMGVIVGKLAAYLGCRNFPPYNYDDINNIVIYKDYHFYHNCPLVLKNDVGFVLFSILCNINYAIKFVENYFVENIPQKFKFAYLQYYYLCDFIREMNELLNTKLELNSSLKNRNIRNCLAHYGLGQFMKETDIDKEDILKGITVKAFNMEYYHCKELLYDYLNKLAIQIKYKIF